MAEPEVWYLSFVDVDKHPHEWLGGCFVRGWTFHHAWLASHLLKINPGGQVAGWGPMPADSVRPEYLERLLTTEVELEEAEATVLG